MVIFDLPFCDSPLSAADFFFFFFFMYKKFESSASHFCH